MLQNNSRLTTADFGAFDERFVKRIDAAAQVLEPWLIRVVRTSTVIPYDSGERPDRLEHGVIVGEHGFDAVAPGVRHLDAVFPYFSDDLLDHLNLDCLVVMGAAGFVGSFPTGWGAVHARPACTLRAVELVPASGALDGQFDRAREPNSSVASPLCGLLSFAPSCGFVGVDLAHEQDQASLSYSVLGIWLGLVDIGELGPYPSIQRRQVRFCRFEFSCVASFPRGDPACVYRSSKPDAVGS